MKLIINTDGASRGNPGMASVGAVISSEDGKVLKTISEFLGDKLTNNEAEYRAVIYALKEAKRIVGKQNIRATEVEIRADSELLTKQLNGEYKLSSEKIQKFFIEVWNLKVEFKKITFVHVMREYNKEADRLANEALDRNPQSLF